MVQHEGDGQMEYLTSQNPAAIHMMRDTGVVMTTVCGVNRVGIEGRDATRKTLYASLVSCADCAIKIAEAK